MGYVGCRPVLCGLRLEGETMTKRTCETCRWFDARATGYGHCRKRSPIVMGEECFPSTHVTDWCGEWSDASITPEQEDRQELTRRFALAIVSTEYGVNLRDDMIWTAAKNMAAAEPQIQREGQQ